MTLQLLPLHRGLVIDTGPLLIHAFSTFRGGRFLPDVAADIPGQDLQGVADSLGRVLKSARRVVITPEVLVEFQALSQVRAGLDRDATMELLTFYSPVLTAIEEWYMPKDRLLKFKGDTNSWSLCFTDSSLVLTARELSLPILTQDRELRNRSENLRVRTLHLYYDLYLGVV